MQNVLRCQLSPPLGDFLSALMLPSGAPREEQGQQETHGSRNWIFIPEFLLCFPLPGLAMSRGRAGNDLGRFCSWGAPGAEQGLHCQHSGLGKWG